MTVFSHSHDSIGALIDSCTASVGRVGVHNSVSGGVTRSAFIGRTFGSWDDVITAVNSPWPEGIETVRGMIDELRGESDRLPRPKDRRRRRGFSEDSGDEVDFDRLQAGQPYWTITRREQVSGPQRIALIADVSTNGNVTADRILWRGVTALVLSDLLEQAGYRVGLWAVHHSSHTYPDGRGQFSGVMLKNYQQPLDVTTLINAVSGWFFRTVWFQDVYARTDMKPVPTLGSAAPIRPDMPEVTELVGAGCVPEVIDGVWSRAATLAKIRSVIINVNSTEGVPT